MADTPTLSICVNRRLTDTAPSCGGRGAERLAELLEQALLERRVQLPLERVDCLGRCGEGPNLRLAPEGHFFTLHHEAEIPALLKQLLHHLD